ncbi:MAG: transposase [Candidatus Omnitrophota bacterium]|nr:transposase [Candidatus Omnitrophota bacterium]
MKSIVTIKLKIPQKEEILETVEKYSKAVSYIADEGFKSGIVNRYALHHLCYYKAREKFKLPSQFIINANRIASQTLKSVKTNKGNKPVFKEFLPLPFDKRTFTFSSDKIRITTIKGRINVPIEVPEYYWKYLDWNPQTAQIVKTRKGLFIHITFSRNVNSCVADGKTVGVDVGINHIAVTSNKQFFSGSKVKSCMLKFKRLRCKLQAKGTQSSKKLLRKLGGRERRFKAWANHNVSKRIVDNCRAGDTIVMENIKGIRRNKGRKLNFWLHGWNFYQLQRFTSYKAVEKGVRTIKVNPYLTSQTCSRCGKVGTRVKGFFRCPHCGYSLNADLNASRNLAKHDSMPDRVSAVVNQPNIPNDESKTVNRIADEFRDNTKILGVMPP